MKTNLKRVLLFSLLVLTLVCLTVVGISAATTDYTDDVTAASNNYAVRIGEASAGNYYATLADAVEAATDDDIITVIKAHSLSAALTIDKNLTIMGQGLEITTTTGVTISGATVVLDNVSMSGSTVDTMLTIKNSADVTINGSNSNYVHSGANYTILVQAKLTINSGSFDHTGGSRVIWSNNAASNTVINYAVFNYTGTNYAIGMSNGNITVKDGKFKTTTGSMLFFVEGAAVGALNIEGGTFETSKQFMIQARGTGKAVNISGGTFTSTYNNSTKPGAIGRFSITTVNVTGGTFTAANNVFVLYSGGSQDKNRPANGATWSFKNATITADGGSAISLPSVSTYTVNSVSVDSCTINATDSAIAVNTATTKVEITDTTIDATGDAIVTTVVTAVTVTGGSITTDGAAFNLADDATALAHRVVIEAASESAGTVTVTGLNPYKTDADAITDGMTIRVGEQGAILTQYFADLATAISSADVESGAVIEIIAPFTHASTATIDKDLTINGNGHLVSSALAGVNFYLNGGTVVFNNFNFKLTTETSADFNVFYMNGDKTVVTFQGEDTVLDASGMLTASGNLFNVYKGADTTLNIVAGDYHAPNSSNGDSHMIWASGNASVPRYINIEGGNFYDSGLNRCLVGGAAGINITVSGGAFYVDQSQNVFFAENTAVFTINAGVTATVKDKDGNDIEAVTPYILKTGGNNVATLDFNCAATINGGTFVNTAKGAWLITSRRSGATVTVNGGSFESAGFGVLATSNFTMTGGELSVAGDAIRINGAIDVNVSGTAVIEGGYSINTNAAAAGATLVIDGGEIKSPLMLDADITTTIKSGTFTSTGNIFNIAAGTLNISGTPSFTAEAGAAFELLGTPTLDLKGGTFSVKHAVLVPKDMTAEIHLNGGNFTCSGTAISFEGAADVDFYFDGADISATYIIYYASNAGSYYISGGNLEASSRGFDGGLVSLEMSGGTLTAPWGVWLNGSSNTNTSFVMTGGTINSTVRGVGTSKGASITISGGTIDMYAASSYGAALYIEGENATATISGTALLKQSVALKQALIELRSGKVVISGGAFSSHESSAYPLIYLRNTSVAEITGGSFTSTSATGAFYLAGTSQMSIGGTANVNLGGSVLHASSVGTMNITGGTFATTGDLFTIGAATLNISGTPTMTADGKAFNISGAATITVSGGSITVAGNVLDVNGGATVDLNGGTLTSTAAYGIYMNTADAAVVTLNGAYLKGASYAVTYGSTKDVDTAATIINIKAGTLHSGTGRLNVGNNGTVNISGGTVTSDGTRTIWANGGSPAINITGGVITNANDKCDCLVGGSKGLFTISGGTFTSTGSRMIFGENMSMIIKAAENGTVPTFTHTGSSTTGSTLFDLSGGGKFSLTIEAGEFTTNANVIVYRNRGTDSVVTITGGSFEANRGILTDDYTTTKGVINLNGGTMNVNGYAIYTTIAVEDLVINIDGMDIAQKAATSENFFYLVYHGVTLNIHSGKLTCLSTANQSLMRFVDTINIYGGTMIAPANVEITIYPVGATAVLNVYGGYIEGGGKYMIRPAGSATTAATETTEAVVGTPAIVNIYGGHFVQTNSTGNNGAVIRVGTASNTAIANVYGGFFETTGLYNYIFWAANEADAVTPTTVNLHSYTCDGGRAILIVDSNDSKADDIYYANADRTAAVNTISVETGASVRLIVGSAGIRFTSTISAGFQEMIAGLGATNISYGTVIVPADYLKNLSTFSIEALKSNGKKYLDIPAVEGIIENDDGSITIRAAMVNLKESNYNRRFSAVVYAKYTIGEQEYYYFSGYDKVDNARSMAYIAQEAQTLTSATKDDFYKYEIQDVNEEIVYSPYSQDQYNLLAAYVATIQPTEVDIYLIAGQSNGSGYSPYNKAFAAMKEEFTAGYSNVLYAGAGASGSGYELIELENVIAGMGSTYDNIGAELGMADILSQYYNAESKKTAVIIKWADGGTNLFDVIDSSNARIGNWYPPSYIEQYGCQDENLSGGQYRKLVEVFGDTIDDLKTMGYTDFNLNGMFWMQGEAECNIGSFVFNGETVTIDAAVKGTAASPVLGTAEVYSYPNVFKALVTDLRADLGEIIGDADEANAMPVVVGEISSTFGCVHAEYNTSFITMQNTVLPQYISNCYSVGSGVLATGTDSSHFTADDMLTIGQMVGTKLLNVNFSIEAVQDAPVAAVYAENGTLIEQYSSLSMALNSAPAGATVKLLGDHTVNAGALNINNANAITFDGDGHTLYSNSADRAINFIGTNITLKNLNVTHRVNSDDAYIGYFYNKANVTIENGNYTSSHYGFVVNSEGSSLTINGGTFTTTKGTGISHSPVYVGSASDVVINGGNFVSGAAAGAYTNNTGATITVNGGTFTNSTNYATYTNKDNSRLFVIDLDKIVLDGPTYAGNRFTTPENNEINNETDAAYEAGKTDAQVESEIFVPNHLLYTMTSSTERKQMATISFTGDVVIKDCYYPTVEEIKDENGNVTDTKTVYVTEDVTLTNPVYKTGQGGTKVGNYYYKAMLSNGGLASVYPDYYSYTIGKYNLDGTLVSYSTPMDLDHANDLVYVAATDTLYVVHNQPRAKRISVFKANAATTDAPTYIASFNLDQAIYSMDYNAERDMFVVGCSGGETIAFFAGSSFPNATNTAEEITALGAVPQLFKVATIQSHYTTQGITCDANYIYMAQHAMACLQVYDWDGNYVGYIKGLDIMNSTVSSTEKSTSWFTTTWTETRIGGEIESVSYDAQTGKFYFTVLIGETVVDCKQYTWSSDITETTKSNTRYAYLVVVDAQEIAASAE